MRIFFKYRNVFAILLFLLFLNSCTTKYASANITNDPSNTEMNASDKIIDVPKTEEKPEAAQDIQKSTSNNLPEGDPLLKDLSEITSANLPLDTSQIVGDDQLIEAELKRIMLEFGEDD